MHMRSRPDTHRYLRQFINRVILLHYLSVFVAAVQAVLLEEVPQRPEHFQSARSPALQNLTHTALFGVHSHVQIQPQFLIDS